MSELPGKLVWAGYGDGSREWMIRRRIEPGYRVYDVYCDRKLYITVDDASKAYSVCNKYGAKNDGPTLESSMSN